MPLKSGPLGVSTILFSSHPLLPATLYNHAINSEHNLYSKFKTIKFEIHVLLRCAYTVFTSSWFLATHVPSRSLSYNIQIHKQTDYHMPLAHVHALRHNS